MPSRASSRIPSGRYFGFVIGGALPAALAADWLTSVWDQNAGLVVCGPSAAVCEEIAGEWLKDLLGIPADASFAFVTGCQMAHVTCLAAARHDVLGGVGWDVEADGLAGCAADPRRGRARKHVTVDRALRLLGLGSGAPDPRRRRRAGPDASSSTRSGTCSATCRPDDRLRAGGRGEHRRVRPDRRRSPTPARRAAPGSTSTARSACGLPRRPSSATSSRGVERADSWATDAHKWLNVPYDSGLAFVAHADAHRAAMRLGAEYLVADEGALATRWTGRRSSRGVLAGSRSTRRCARSAGRASPTSSRGRARGHGSSRRRWRSSRAARS